MSYNDLVPDSKPNVLTEPPVTESAAPLTGVEAMAIDECPPAFIRSEINATKMISIADIMVSADRLRALQPDKVNILAKSMQTQGLLQAIGVRPYSAPPYQVVFGVHRLEAAKALSWESIRATVFNGINADQAQLAEIDENLCRAELGPAEEAAHLAARKAIYLRLHPETGRGGDRSKSQNETLAPAFIDDTAARTGKGRATIARQTARGERIDDVGSLAGTSLDKGIELDALSKMSKSEQHELIARAKAGEQISAKSPSTSINSIPDPYALETLKGLPVPGRIQIVTGIFSTLTNDEIRAALPAQVKAELVQSAVDLEKSRASQDRHELEELVEDVCRAMATNEPVERQAEHVKHIVKEFKGRNGEHHHDLSPSKRILLNS